MPHIRRFAYLVLLKAIGSRITDAISSRAGSPRRLAETLHGIKVDDGRRYRSPQWQGLAAQVFGVEPLSAVSKSSRSERFSPLLAASDGENLEQLFLLQHLASFSKIIRGLPSGPSFSTGREML